MNCMLGDSNFDTELKRMTTGTNLMIACVHIAHQIGDKLYCPSITAVVASTQDSILHYPGSTRIQATTAMVESAKKPSRGCVSQITSLKDMMLERFKTWESPPATLLFFHDGIIFQDRALETERADIHAAFKTAFPE
jgi:hypothetical protein